jgi:hypothetical protein
MDGVHDIFYLIIIGSKNIKHEWKSICVKTLDFRKTYFK